MYSYEYDVVGAYTYILCLVALCYAQNAFCYVGADAVNTHVPFPVFGKAYALTVVCPIML